MLLVQSVKPGSSVDPEMKVVPMEVQQSSNEKGANSAQTSDDEEDTKEDSKDKKISNTPAEPPPKR